MSTDEWKKKMKRLLGKPWKKSSSYARLAPSRDSCFEVAEPVLVLELKGEKSMLLCIIRRR
jgi:hypothetical protein